MAIDPEAFYAAMPKPDAPNDRMLAQSKLVVPPAPPATPRDPDEAEVQARRFYGHHDVHDRVGPEGVSPKSQRALSGLLTGRTRSNASMSSAGNKRRTGLSGCSAKRRWTVCATTRSS
jgi:hypothetical protein